MLQSRALATVHSISGNTLCLTCYISVVTTCTCVRVFSFIGVGLLYVIISDLSPSSIGTLSFPKRKVGWSQAMKFSQGELNTAKNSPGTSCCQGNHSSLYWYIFHVARYLLGKVYDYIPRNLIISFSVCPPPSLSLSLFLSLSLSYIVVYEVKLNPFLPDCLKATFPKWWPSRLSLNPLIALSKWRLLINLLKNCFSCVHVHVDLLELFVYMHM